MLALFSLLSASWAHFSRLVAFVAPFGRFFGDLGRSSLDFGAPSWAYVGTYFALGGIFGHGAGIAAKKPCWHSLSVFRFHNAARRYVRSTSAASRRESRACQTSCQILAKFFSPQHLSFQSASSKLWAQDSFLKCLPPILCSFPRTRTYRRTSSAICS